MSFTSSHGFLRRVLLADALSSAAMGFLFVMFAEQIGPLFSLPIELLTEAGWILCPFAGFVAYVSSRHSPSRTAVWAIIALNAVWIINSVLLLFSSSIQPNVLGQAFIVAQAAFVLVITELEYVGLKRAAATTG
jgi:hypothetical protein